jgi:hypothetical protein
LTDEPDPGRRSALRAAAFTLNRKEWISMQSAASRTRLNLEALEARLTPFRATMMGAELLVLGTYDPDTILIVDHGLGNSGKGDDIDLTTDGQRRSFSHISQIVVNTGNGGDMVTVSGSLVAVNSIHLTSGGGNDTFAFDGAVNPTGPNALHITLDTGAGDDGVAFGPFGFASMGADLLDLNINTGAGDDSVSLHDFAFGPPPDGPAGQVAARININTGAGDDAVSVSNFAFNGTGGVAHPGSLSLNVDGGAGDDSIVLQDIHVSLPNEVGGLPLSAVRVAAAGGAGSGKDTSTMTGFDIDGTLGVAIDAGAGDDVIEYHGKLHRPAHLAFGLGAGDDKLTLEDGDFMGATDLRIDAGAGDDVVSINRNNAHDAFTATVHLGAGDDSAYFMENTFIGTTNLSLDAGAGSDEWHFTTTVFTGPATLKVELGAGDDQFSIDQSSASAAATVTVDGGAGNDNLSVNIDLQNASTVSATVQLFGGSGDDDLSLFANTGLNGPGMGTFTIDGGVWFDTAHADPFVKVVNCEM